MAAILSSPYQSPALSEKAHMERHRNTRCPSCLRGDLQSFYAAASIPVHSCLLLDSRQAALDFPRADLELGVCDECGFISNMLYAEALQNYGVGYEDQQSYSPTFNRFAEDLAQRLVEHYALKQKTIVEIGCSKGDFLALLCRLGQNRGIGIDPACDERLSIAGITGAEQISFVREKYAEKHGAYGADFICCRHTLEHIGETGELVRAVHRAAGSSSGVTVFFEVPDTRRVLEEGAFWDIYYEHCSYFTAGSLARLFRGQGFEVIDLSIEYDRQYLLLHACPGANDSHRAYALEEPVSETLQWTKDFSANVRDSISSWQRRFSEFASEGKKVAVWGSGSKCVAFLSTLGAAADVGRIVDINPNRHSKFLAGLGAEICSPRDLCAYKPDIVIIMNPIYTDEIKAMLGDLSLGPQCIAL